MSEFERAQKNLKNDLLFLSILELIILGFSFFKGYINVFSLGFAIFLFLGFFLAKNGSKVVGTIGIIVGILMVLTILKGDIIDFLLGLFIVLHSSKYLKSF